MCLKTNEVISSVNQYDKFLKATVTERYKVLAKLLIVLQICLKDVTVKSLLSAPSGETFQDRVLASI